MTANKTELSEWFFHSREERIQVETMKLLFHKRVWAIGSICRGLSTSAYLGNFSATGILLGRISYFCLLWIWIMKEEVVPNPLTQNLGHWRNHWLTWCDKGVTPWQRKTLSKTARGRGNVDRSVSKESGARKFGCLVFRGSQWLMMFSNSLRKLLKLGGGGSRL